MKHKEDFVADKFYHIYNRANGSELLFRSDDNYTYFLKKYTQYVSPIADTYAYCLMPNHFHFLIQMKSEETLLDFFTKQGKDFQEDAETFRKAIFQQFSNLFNAYAKAYNKMYHRNGSLFQTAPHCRTGLLGSDNV